MAHTSVDPEVPVTIAQIAQEAGVSVGTVSQVLSGKHQALRPRTAKRAKQIREIASRLNYRPSSAARAMVRRRSQLIGVVVPNSSLPRQDNTHLNSMETVLGLTLAMDEAGYVTTMVPVTDLPSEDRAPSRVFTEHMLDGLVMLGHIGNKVQVDFDQLSEPYVWVDSQHWDNQRCIRRDEVDAGHVATQALIDAGYRKLLVIGSDPDEEKHYSAAQRLAGITQAAAKADMPIDKVFGNDTAFHAQTDWFANLPIHRDTGVVIATAYTAHYFIGQSAMHGLRPGKDFGLICCEDSSLLMRTLPELTRVSFDRHEMGGRAALMIRQVIEQPQSSCPSLKFKNTLIPGRTAPGPDHNV